MLRFTCRQLGFLGLLSVAAMSSACAAAPADDDAAASGTAAATASPEYDAVVRDGRKVVTDKVASATQSASTRLVAYVPAGNGEELLGKLLSLGRWTEIRNAKGKQPFSDSAVGSDVRSGASRTVKAKLTIQSLLSVDLAALGVAEGEGFRATITNTASVSHFLAGGTVIETGKLVVDVKIIPHQRGVIVDATMRVKAKKLEDKASDLTETIEPLFDWVQAGG